MSQHDYVIDNQDGASFRADINSALAAVVSCNSGATAPAATFAYQVWHDTTTGIIKQRNPTNTAWLNLADVLLADKTVNGLLTYTNQITLGTSQATTSGTSKDFTGIPSWVRRITLMFNGVSTSGTNAVQVHLGTSGGFETSGYVGGATAAASASAGFTSFTSGLVLSFGADSAATTRHGAIQINNLSGNAWMATGGFASADISPLVLPLPTANHLQAY